MAVRVVVCDDDKSFLEHICKQIAAIFKNLSVNATIERFDNGKWLCKELKTSEFDLLFLDIEMEDMNGVQIGRYIRETLGNESIQIAYISAKQEYAMDLFDFRPINFLIKPIDNMALEKVIDKFILLNQHNMSVLNYKKGKNDCSVRMSEIIYLSSSGRKITMHMLNNRTEDFYGSLENIYKKSLEKENFLFVHKSFLVNFNYIKSYEYSQLTMLYGDAIPISQSRRKNIRTRFNELQKSFDN